MKLPISPFALLFIAGLLPAQVNVPQVGFVRYADHTVRPIYGVSSNFVAGKTVLDSADAASFSDSGGLVSRNGHIELVTRDGTVLGQYDSGETAPLLNIDGDAKTAIAWLPVHHALLYWDGKSFATIQVQDGTLFGPVSSVRLASFSTAKLLVTDPEEHVFEVTISLETGNLISSDLLPGVQGPAFRQHSFVLFHDQQGLEIESPGGDLRTLPLEAGDIAIERMSSDWLHLSSPATGQNWALHLSNTVLHLSALPAPRSALTQETAK
jgi:hypothetical protein